MIEQLNELRKQNEKMKKQLHEQKELTHELRKQFLKEINNLREANNQGHEKFKEALQVSFFDVTEGYDQNVVEVLNMKLADMRRQFNQ